MNDEKARFKKQFTDPEWAKLNADLRFREAWNDENLIKAGEIAPQIVVGDAKTKAGAKILNDGKKHLGDLMS